MFEKLVGLATVVTLLFGVAAYISDIKREKRLRSLAYYTAKSTGEVASAFSTFIRTEKIWDEWKSANPTAADFVKLNKFFEILYSDKQAMGTIIEYYEVSLRCVEIDACDRMVSFDLNNIEAARILSAYSAAIKEKRKTNRGYARGVVCFANNPKYSKTCNIAPRGRSNRRKN